MLKFIEISKIFGRQVAVDNLSLEIGRGELYGFLGPNGAGKTTTIKMAAGILKPSSGRIEIDGIDIQKQPEKAKMLIGYVPDTPYIYDRLTAREYLEFIGGLYGISKAQIEVRATELFELFDMNGWVDRRCEQYSHGMRQKVVFAAAMLHRPPVLVVDEPMVGLDPQSARTVKDLLKNYAAAGNAVFVSTHILSVAEELCDKIGIINGGKLIASGKIAELRTIVDLSDGDLESLFLKLTNG